MRRPNSEKLSDAQVKRLEERRKELGITRQQFYARFEQSLKELNLWVSTIASKQRLDRVLIQAMRTPMSDTTKAALAHALGWSVAEFEAAIYEKRDGQARRERPSNPTSNARQIGFKALVQIESHQITRGMDLSKVNLAKVYDAAHRMFLRVRELMGELPVDEFARNSLAQRIYEALDATLNNTLRPHLTKWPERYGQWRDEFTKTKAGSKLSAQQLQKRFPERVTLVRELNGVAKRLQGDASKLKSIIFTGD